MTDVRKKYLLRDNDVLRVPAVLMFAVNAKANLNAKDLCGPVGLRR